MADNQDEHATKIIVFNIFLRNATFTILIPIVVFVSDFLIAAVGLFSSSFGTSPASCSYP